jgi:plastocyanin
MFFSKAIVALASLAAVASAQSSTAAAAAPSASVAVHVVKALVQGGKPVFEPAEVKAAVGDLIQFQFYPMNHSVVRASFDNPCVPIEDNANSNVTGFYSGFMPISADTEMMPTFTIAVEDTKPIWFYCSQGRHCQSGMVGVVNPTSERTLALFMQAAAKAEANLSPGQEDVGNGAATTTGSNSPTPTTMETSRVSTSATSTSTDIIPNAASKLGSSFPLVLAAVAASFFLL